MSTTAAAGASHPSHQPPYAGLAGLAPGDAMDSARLLGVIVALAGEVFVLKAELARMKTALAERDALDQAALDRAAQSPALAQWLAGEQAAFGRSLLRPFTHPDECPDVTRFMEAR